MALQVQEITVGVDVSKHWLDLAVGPQEPVLRIDNSAVAIEAWIAGLAGPAVLGVEATGSYHEALCLAAAAAGHTVYLVDGLRLCRYRDSVGGRVKSDVEDARLLQRYVSRERSQLRAWRGPDPGATRLWRLLKRRATVVRSRVQLAQSVSELPELQVQVEPVLRQLRALLRQIDRDLLAQARALGWSDQVRRLQQVAGLGKLTALGLVAAYHRGEFATADRFVAFLGLDVRVRESGKWRGKRRLSKKGEPEIRRLLYNAAMHACRRGRCQAYYGQLLGRGLPRTAALVALARKLVRLAFALLRDGSEFNPARWETCPAT